ncbi:hypothetical protein CAPN010_16450 [Capnocytophaga cynodegmi]|uniref:DUF3127 domain-containing protein n=1 Tax=Capnocytophaga cynodegmi TaxID=28189 RepID=UPI001EE24442|nr:DUF3127 domain-containing protein [Capnocytophaga cynodegmi]GJQ07487.1 hypothetical protein CAPN010_16450 [Capnocytophaga cynodegmi]
MDIQGRVKFIGKTEFVGQNGFQKRDLVITTEEQYPQHIIIQFTQDKCTLLDNLQLGQKVNVHFNLRGREWISPQGEIKYFNTLDAWKIEMVQVTKVANQGYQGTNYQVPQQQPPTEWTPAPQEQNPSYQPPVYQNPQQPQQTQMFDNNGQAPTQNEENDDLPF